ncbi:hypothetical protein BpHYR1_027217 [Brachionus plicatilis]|uniref:Uncharacterized protein n=1 Tax=Brachionus plicatilis TaxID=10195 RepID=A0A3M7T890_BRAPC|nr:hypothetical protein BpHYR1_027217 [Brachionus plicatilis]
MSSWFESKTGVVFIMAQYKNTLLPYQFRFELTVKGCVMDFINLIIINILFFFRDTSNQNNIHVIKPELIHVRKNMNIYFIMNLNTVFTCSILLHRIQ